MKLGRRSLLALTASAVVAPAIIERVVVRRDQVAGRGLV